MAGCDVAVIGAGVIGQSIAYELAVRGAAVTLLDARGIGLGSTQAAAGMLVPFLEGFGRPLLPLATRSLEMYGLFVERLTRETGIDVGYTRSGSLQVATEDESIAELKVVAASAQTAGVECSLLDARQTLEWEPRLTPDVRAGLSMPAHGFVGAIDLSAALSAGAVKHGARLMVPARVRRISPRGGEMEIQLETGDQLTSRQIVVAAGCWSGQIEIEGIPPLPVRPVRGQLLQLAWPGEPLKRIVWGPRCYIVPSGPGTILVGATVEDVGFDERTTVAGVRDLLDAACDLVPHVWQASLTALRVGLRPATVDDMPVIGRSRVVPGVVYATGHFRNGVLLAPLTAKAVADVVLDNREDPLLAAASPQRFGEY
jgi:glycine oxidase